MKKIKYFIVGIFSLFLFSPVFGLDLDSVVYTFLSHESLNFDYNIDYYFSSTFYYYNTSQSKVYSIGTYQSTSTQIGDTVDTDISPFQVSGDLLSVINFSSSYFSPLFGLGLNNNNLDPSRFSIYFQSHSQSTYNNYGNRLLRFVGNNSQGQASVLQLKNSYIRMLYNNTNFSDLWFYNNNYPVSTVINPASSIQLFQYGNNYFMTEKGKFSVAGRFINKVSPSFGNGFSFISSLDGKGESYYWDDVKFYSVMPNWDNRLSSLSVPSSRWSSDYYIFKLDNYSQNNSRLNIGVLSKCTLDFCSNLDLTGYYSSLVYSEYLCDFSNGYDLINNCIFSRGGLLNGALPFTGGTVPVVLNNHGSINVPFGYILLNSFYKASSTSYYAYNPYISFSCDGSNLTLYTQYSTTVSVSTPLTLGNYDILSVSNIPDIGGGGSSSDIPIELTTGSISDLIRQRCVNNSSFYSLNKERCNRLGVGFGAGGSEIPSYINGGETCLKIIQFLDEDGNMVEKYVNCDEDLSDGMYVDSSGNVYFYNSGYYQHTNYFQSGLVQSGFYEDSNSWFFSCPYPVNFQSGSKFVEFFANSNIGSYNLGLPLVCFYGAFQAGKTYNFLSDVNLGLIPLMGEIQGPNDPRNYLYRFLDFLLSLVLFFFLVKFYHFYK